MSERVWMVSYHFDGLQSHPHPVGCVCSEFNEVYGLPPDHWTMHHHTDGKVRRKPDRIIKAGDKDYRHESQPTSQNALSGPQRNDAATKQ